LPTGCDGSVPAACARTPAGGVASGAGSGVATVQPVSAAVDRIAAATRSLAIRRTCDPRISEVRDPPTGGFGYESRFGFAVLLLFFA